MQDVLIMAMTRMRSGICTAGFINEPHSASGLQWVRPVKEYGSLLLGDMSDAKGRVVQVGDVIALNLLKPRPDPTHAEDWLTDFVRRRPRRLRRLEGEKRASFLAEHVDQAPEEILCSQKRSLCLLAPDAIWSSFSLDLYSGKYEARIGFRLDGLVHERTAAPQGVPVTDLKWRALGRGWLETETAGAGKKGLALDQKALLDRLQAERIYLSVGLSRPYKRRLWPLVVGVHPVPDYEATIDYEEL